MTFLEKYELLIKSIPVPAVTIGPDTIDCEYVDNTYRSKNCHYCINGSDLIGGIYTNLGLGIKLVDCASVVESEKCYECNDCNKCHSCTYLMDCNSCTDCHFSAFLNSCTECFGCVALTHKKYCIFNKQYTKEEYLKMIIELKKEKPEKNLEKMVELKHKIPHPASQQINNENCPYGDYIYNSNNCYWCFNSYYCENSGYNYVSGRVNNCWDLFFSGGNIIKKTISERCYEFVDSANCYDCAFLNLCESCTNCDYGTWLLNCSDCFGCVGLKNKKYCVLNNQLTKVQYDKTVREIKNELGWKS